MDNKNNIRKVYTDKSSGVKFCLENVTGMMYKINPLNLESLGLTSYTEFISLKDLDKLIKEDKISRGILI